MSNGDRIPFMPQGGAPSGLPAPSLFARHPVLATLRCWVKQGWLSELDCAFAAFLGSQCPQADARVLLAAALLSRQLARGHVFLDLADAQSMCAQFSQQDAGADEKNAMGSVSEQGISRALEGLEQAVRTGTPLVTQGAGDTPLVVQGSRLYLRRYWQYTQDVQTAIQARLPAGDSMPLQHLPAALLRSLLDVLFAHNARHTGMDWQKAACALALRSNFTVITGGPGTGKTTTVLRLLALLQGWALAGASDGAVQPNGMDTAAASASPLPAPRALRIRLAAPTGKAAARLKESIAGAVQTLPYAALAQTLCAHAGNAVSEGALRAAIPVEVSTLHRLLGSLPGSRHFRHHADNPLALDVLVVDEASMVDLEMMAATLAALPSHARLVLLGDKDQLASVEAGAVLGTLCQHAAQGRYTPQTCAWLQDMTGHAVPQELVDAAGTPLDQAVAMLRVSHRFGAYSGIGQLAHAVNAGHARAVHQLLGQARGDRELLELDAADAVLSALVLGTLPGAKASGGYRHYLQAMVQKAPAHNAEPASVDAWARDVLQHYARFQLLCVLREGPWGVDGLNRRIARILHAHRLIPSVQGWYAGRPVLLTRNDYSLQLMNGDVGIAMHCPGAGLRVAFAMGDGTGNIRWVQPARLSHVQTVYAMTVHKSQGSEFAHVALVLPARPNPVLTRELVYTGITRARERLSMALPQGAQHVLTQAVQQRVRRAG